MKRMMIRMRMRVRDNKGDIVFWGIVLFYLVLSFTLIAAQAHAGDAIVLPADTPHIETIVEAELIRHFAKVAAITAMIIAGVVGGGWRILEARRIRARKLERLQADVKNNKKRLRHLRKIINA